jgi:hypothetical protein
LVVLLSACGGASHATAKTKSPCPAGETLVEGRFHYEACVASTVARVAKICAETKYELEGIVRREVYPIPDATRPELAREALESEATLTNAIVAMKATGESDSSELAALSMHRAGVHEVELKATRSSRRIPISALLKPFEFRPCVR